MANPDLSALSTSFNKMGGPVLRKKVLAWDVRQQGIKVYTKVTTPIVLPKLSAVGGPRPYRSQDDTSGNGVKVTDQTLIAYQSKWDNDFDYEEFRNTYLGDELDAGSFAQAANEQIGAEYLQAIKLQTLWFGVRNGSGTTAADICDGFGTIIAADIISTKIPASQVINTGPITTTNAVDSVETLAEGVSTYMRENGFFILCPFHVFDKFKKNYRQLYGFNFDPTPTGGFKLDNMNATLQPTAIIPQTSGRLLATVKDNLCIGTNVEDISLSSSVRRNIIENRPMIPMGCQYADPDLMYVNEQA